MQNSAADGEPVEDDVQDAEPHPLASPYALFRVHAPRYEDGHLPDAEHRAVRGWSWALSTMAVGVWFLQLRSLGFEKPNRNAMDPVSAAAYNHQQNLAWASHVFWIMAIPAAAAVLGALVAGRAPLPGRRICAAAFGAFLGTCATGIYFVYEALGSMRFVF